jgi:hypothetical protein
MGSRATASPAPSSFAASCAIASSSVKQLVAPFSVLAPNWITLGCAFWK